MTVQTRCEFCEHSTSPSYHDDCPQRRRQLPRWCRILVRACTPPPKTPTCLIGIVCSPSPPSYVPYTEETAGITSCGIPQNYNASKEWADKKVVLFAVPGQSCSPNWNSAIRPRKLNTYLGVASGAFTPSCSAKHLPAYIENLDKIKGKGVDLVAVLAYNDAWVMSAWAKANAIKEEIVRFLLPTNSSRRQQRGADCSQTALPKRSRYQILQGSGLDDG